MKKKTGTKIVSVFFFIFRYCFKSCCYKNQTVSKNQIVFQTALLPINMSKTNTSKKNRIITVVVILLVLIIDQLSKIWVKTNMSLYESIEIAQWFKIYFVENNGMAFGWEVGGKLFLSLFRIIAIVLIAYYLHILIKRKYAIGFTVCIALIWAGALGNIIDSVFYGEIFSQSLPNQVATFVPFGEGYSSILHGKVVDMLYFPLVNGTFPEWVPQWGGENFIFFSPIFNIADSAITVGIFILLLFYRKTFSHSIEGKRAKR